eukprot:6454188-Pyramimonas_sp.AAC.1
MHCSGNPRARAFFKQQGWADSGAAKVDAKYTSRAAELYRATLQREASAMKVTLTISNTLPSSPPEYTSRAAELYRATLQREAAAVKVTLTISNVLSSSPPEYPSSPPEYPSSPPEFTSRAAELYRATLLQGGLWHEGRGSGTLST